MNKKIVIRVRITETLHVDLLKQAQHAGVTLSELVRQLVVNKPVVSRADVDAAKSIDKIGRMLKHYYPKDKDWANAEDKRKWWQLAEELRETARSIRRGGKR